MSTASSSAPPYSRLRRLWALGALTSVEFMENGMVLFGATQIIDGLHLSAQAFALAQTLYGVAAIVMLVKHQWVVERIGYRRFAALSLGVFGLGSLICCLADGTTAFLLGRMLQGLGGATFFTAGRLAVSGLAPSDRGTGMKTFICSLLGATAVSPLLAAAMLATVGWRGIFALGVLQAFVIAQLACPQLSSQTVAPGQRSREHWGWVGGMATGVFGLQYAVQAIGQEGHNWPALLTAMAVGAALLAAFAWRQYLNDKPLINYRGLLQTRYLVGLALYFSGYFLIGITGLLVPALLHLGLALPFAPTAAITSAGMFASLAMAMLHVSVANRWPKNRVFMLAGLVLYGLGSIWLALTDGMTLTTAAAATLTLSLAIPLFMGPVAAGTFTELKEQDFSHGYQVKNIVRQLGLSSSIAVGTLGLHTVTRFTHQSAEWGTALLPPAAVVTGCQTLFLTAAGLVLPLSLLVLRQRVFR